MSTVDGNRKGRKKGLGRAGVERARPVPALPRTRRCQQCTGQEGRATGISFTCRASQGRGPGRPGPPVHAGGLLLTPQNPAEWGIGTGPALRRSWRVRSPHEALSTLSAMDGGRQRVVKAAVAPVAGLSPMPLPQGESRARMGPR